jgi:hypothetical protein
VKKIAKVDKIKGSSYTCLREAFASAGSDTNTSTVTEEEIRRVLIETAPVAIHDFVSRFRPRLRTPEVKHTGFVMRFALKYCVLNNCMVFCFSYYFTPWIHLITDLYLFQCMHPAVCALCMHMILMSCFVIHVLQDKQHLFKIVKKFAKMLQVYYLLNLQTVLPSPELLINTFLIAMLCRMMMRMKKEWVA